MFLVATLYFGRSTTAVRVRNLSASGALVEGSNLPREGATIMLRRGALEVRGTVVWAASGKAGLTFIEALSVAAWLPTREAKRQTQIDELAFSMKHTGRADASTGATRDEKGPLSTAIAELLAMQGQLCRLGDQLSLDSEMVVKHPEIQLLDVAAQQLGRIVDTLQAGRG